MNFIPINKLPQFKNFMTKYLVLVLSLIAVNIYGQNLNECGIDNNPRLTKVESDFLNEYMNEDQRNGIELNANTVLFITGSGASIIGTKSEYFDNIKRKDYGEQNILTWLIELTEKEQTDSGGYDIIITYWVKVAITKNRKRKILKKLKISST